MKKAGVSKLRQLGSQKKVVREAAPVDPLIEAEDKEIRRLERLLGIAKSKEKNKIVDKLNKEYEEEGIGADFGSFLMDLDGIIGLGGDDTITDEEDFMHEDEVPVDEGKKKKKSKSLREKEPEAESAEEQPRKKSKKSIEDNAADTKKSSAAVVDTAPAVAAQGTYVPPSKRMIQGSSTTPSSSNAKLANKNETKQEKAVRKLSRFINGIINKLTEDTKDRILGEVKELYDVNDTQLVTNLLLDCVFNHVMANHLKISFQLPLFTSFLTAVHALVGDSMATATVHKVFDQFLGTIEQGQDLEWNKQSHNVLLVVVYLTMLNVLDLSLVVDLVQFFLRPATFIASVPSTFQRHRFFTALQSLPEMLRMEYVDMILCRVGDRIRREDPATVQDFVQFFQQQLKTYRATQKAAAATTTTTSSGAATASPPPFTRMQFLYESLADFDCKRMQRVRDKHFEEIKEWRKWLSGSVQRLYRSVIVRRQQDEERRRNKAAAMAAANNGGSSSHEGAEGAMAEVPRSVLALVAGSNAYASHNERLFTSATIVIPDKDVDIATAAALLHTSDAASTAAAIAAAGGDAAVKPATHTSAAVVVEQIVAKKGQQLRLNTPNRKAIFGVLMTCRDLEDAYEKIVGLHLGATMDRDLVRVLMECAGKEWPYNPFYAELLKLFCTTMPACKLTTEIAFYDEMAMIVEQEQAGDLSTWEKKQPVKYEQRVMNLARLLADLLMQFKLTLAVLRKVDLTWIADATTAAEEHPMLLLFLSTLFVSMFTYDTSAGGGGGGSSSSGGATVAANDHEGLLLSVCDRLGRSKHYDVVRHVVMHFLETHLKKLPSSVEKDSDMALRMKKGRKIMMKSMRDMEVLHQYTSADTTVATTGGSGSGKGDGGSHDPFDAADEAYFRSRQETASGKKQRGGKKNGKGGDRRVAGGDIGWEMAMGSD